MAAPQQVTDGQWHHLVGTDSGSQVCLFVDGKQTGCEAAPPIYYQPDLVAIGRDGGYSGSYFTGSIDDVAIYGTALSANQVLAHYNAARDPLICPVRRTTTSAYTSAVLATAPRGYWRLDDVCLGTVRDSSGNGLNGTTTYAGVALGQSGAPLNGDTDPSISLDGSYGYVSLGDPAALQPAKVSVEAWINTTAIFSGSGASTTPAMIIVRKRLYGYALYLTTAGTPGFSIDDKTATPYIASGAAAVNDGQWHHLVGTYNGSQVCLYVDGKLAGACQKAGTIYYQPDLVAIGRDGGAASGYFYGRIDEVAIYGAALSAAQVQTHYFAAIPQPTTTTLVSNANPALHATAVTFTATIRAVSASLNAPRGTVTFKDGATTLGTAILNANATAAFTTSTLAVGTHNITASYANADGQYTNSTSAPLSQAVK